MTEILTSWIEYLLDGGQQGPQTSSQRLLSAASPSRGDARSELSCDALSIIVMVSAIRIDSLVLVYVKFILYH